MSKRIRKNKNSTNQSKIYNFVSPMAFDYTHVNDSLNNNEAIYGYGPVEIDATGVHYNAPCIYIPSNLNGPEGVRTLSNCIIECSFSFCQLNQQIQKYELFYPNCSAYLLTGICKNGTNIEDLALKIFPDSHESTVVSQLNPGTDPPINCRVYSRIGMGGTPMNQILDIQPLRTCNGNVEAPQYINQVYIPGPVQLSQGDRIVVLVVVPTAFTFVVPHSDRRVFLQGTCAVRYDINF